MPYRSHLRRLSRVTDPVQQPEEPVFVQKAVSIGSCIPILFVYDKNFTQLGFFLKKKKFVGKTFVVFSKVKGQDSFRSFSVRRRIYVRAHIRPTKPTREGIRYRPTSPSKLHRSFRRSKSGPILCRYHDRANRHPQKGRQATTTSGRRE